MSDSDPITSTDIQEHYQRIASVMDELGDVEGHLTIGLNDYHGWYLKQENDDVASFEEGYPKKGRCATLAKDYDTIAGRIDRALYAVTTYKATRSFTWHPCAFDEDHSETEWMDDTTPMPGYGDLRGVMVWGDVDLADDLKPKRESLDERTQETIESTLAAYTEEFATLYGSYDAVFALDSVGGSYIMGAPAATLPIAEHFDDDEDARERVMEAVVDRSNEWLKDAQSRVETRVEAATSVIDPDWVNNCNRQYKAPLSLHAKQDAVVTPMDVSNPAYELTPFEDVDEDLIGETCEWASDLTDDTHRECVDSVVEHLWPDQYDEADTWQNALDSWVEAERKREQREQDRREAARKRRLERKKEMGGLEGSPITPFIQDVYDAIDRVDTADVVKNFACDEWDTGRDSNDKTEFNPSWRDSSSGTSCFVDEKANTFGDPGAGGGGYAAEAMALGSPDIDYTEPSQTLEGEEWWLAVDELRDAGYDVPVWTPEKDSKKRSGKTYETMPYWAVRKAAVALSVVPEDIFIPAEDSQEGYLSFPGKATYNRALAAIEDEGLEHGREYMTDDGGRPEDVEMGDDATDTPTEDTSDNDEPSTAEKVTTTETSPPGSSVTAGNELSAEGGGYGYWKTTNEGESYFIEVTNFEIETNSFLYHQNKRIVDLTIYPSSASETPYDVTVETKVFNDPRRFRDNIVTGITTTFEGVTSELNDLRTLVGEQDAPRLTGTQHMGLHSDEWVTPQGVLTADGWTDRPETVYIERENDVERAWNLTPENHTGYDADDLVDILERLPNARHSERFFPALGWFYAAAVRPYISDWEDEFNVLAILGGTGAGKTSTLEMLWRLLGMDGEPKSCDDTKFTLTQAMASTNAIPMWFDEYKPSDMADYEVDRFQNLVRKSTKGGVETRGRADQSVEEYRLHAPVVISGEQAIQGPAEERRSIMTTFKEDVSEVGSETLQAYCEITGTDYDTPDGDTVHPEGYDLTQHAYAYYQHILQQSEDELKEGWRASREHVNDVLHDHNITGLDSTPKQGLQTIHFGMTLFVQFAKTVAMEADRNIEVPTEEEVDEALIYVAEQCGANGRRKSHTDRFVELASRAAASDYLEQGIHYTFVNEGKASEELRMNLNLSFDKITQYAKNHDVKGGDLLSRAADYKDRIEEMYEKEDTYIVERNANSPPVNRCVGIHTDRAEETLDNFWKSMWDGEAEIDNPEEHDHIDAEPLWQAGAGYRTLTVKVAKIEEDTPDALLLSGKVEDKSGVVDLIQWNRNDSPERFALEEGKCYRIENGKMTTGKDGALQLELVDGVAEIQEISPGTGHLDYADSGEDSTIGKATTDGGTESVLPNSSESANETKGDSPPSDDDGSDESEDTDEELPQREVVKLIKQYATAKKHLGQAGTPHDVLVKIVVGNGADESRVEHQISKLLQKGELHEPMTGEYLPR